MIVKLHGGNQMTNKGFPQFSRMQDNAHVEILKNYTIPDFVLKLVAKSCDSEISKTGRYPAKLESMNDGSIEKLHDIFVLYKNDDLGIFDQYRFYTFIASMYPKSEILINHDIFGFEKKHRVSVAVKNGGTYVAIAQNKSSGNPINKKDIIKFFDVITDVKDGEYGTTLSDATYCSSVGFRPDALVKLESLKESRSIDPENIIHFKTVNFEDNMYCIVNI